MLKQVMIVMAVLTCSLSASARDFGNRAQSFKIEEQSFLEMIRERLSKLDIQKEQEKMMEIAKERIENPAPVSGVVRALKDRQWRHDPSYILAEDAVLPCGKVLHKAGTKVNPLDHMDLDRRMFFIDARDDEQIAWLEENIGKGEVNSSTEDRIILIGGSPLELSERLDMPVYFDQHGGELTSKWGIEAVPAIVEQDGRELRIEEIKI